MNKLKMLYSIFIYVLIVNSASRFVDSRKSHLPSRLMPPPSKSNLLSGQHLKRSRHPITHLTLHPQPGSHMVAQLHSGALSKPLASKFYTSTTNHLNNPNLSARFNFGKSFIPNGQLTFKRSNFEKSRHFPILLTSIPLNSDSGSLFRDHITTIYKSSSPHTLTLNSDLHPPPLQNQRFKSFQPEETHQLHPPFVPSPNFSPEIGSNEFWKIKNREAKSIRLNDNLIDHKSIATPIPSQHSKPASIRFEENSNLVNGKLTRNSLSRPLSTAGVAAKAKNSLSSLPEPQVVWGTPKSLGVQPQEETNLLLDDLFYPPLTSSKIIFPSDEIDADDSWKPIPELSTLSPIDISAPESSENDASKFLNAWTLKPPLTFNSDSTSHHLFVKSTPLTSAPPFKLKSETEKRNTIQEAQKLAPFFAKFSTQPPLVLGDSEYVIHLNSSERIRMLISFLSRFLVGPPHQLPSELETLSDFNREVKLLNENLPEDNNELFVDSHQLKDGFEIITNNAHSSKFSNGFLDLLRMNSSTNFPRVPEIPILTSAKFQEFIKTSTVSTPYPVETPSPRETPQPVKIDIFSDLNFFEDDPFDLVHSPSTSKLVSVSQFSNSTNDSDNKISYETEKSRNNTESNTLIVSVKASGCPKLHGQVDLFCEVNASRDIDEMNFKWKKVIYTSGGERSDIILSDGGAASVRKDVIHNPRVTLIKDAPPGTSALRVAPFRGRDVGTYECEVDIGGKTASTRVPVFICL